MKIGAVVESWVATRTDAQAETFLAQRRAAAPRVGSGAPPPGLRAWPDGREGREARGRLRARRRLVVVMLAAVSVVIAVQVAAWL